MSNQNEGSGEMKRIITYGLRYQDFATQRDLFALQADGEIEIVAEIAYDPEDPEIFSKRMSIPEGIASEHDGIIVCEGTPEEALERIRQAYREKTPGNDPAAEETLSDLRFKELSELTIPHYERIKQTQLEILKDLVGATDEMVSDREWLRKKLFAYGFYPFFKLVKDPQAGVVWSTRGILQVPDEFLDFCLFLKDVKAEDAIEIGVARGGSSYIMAALLYRNNQDLVYHMVDIADDLNEFDKVVSIIPALRKDIPNTSDDFAGKVYDFCFIDADHSYEGMMCDWNNVGRYAKQLTVFHDVFGHEYDDLNGGTVRGWREIRAGLPDKNIREFSRFPDRWMGIGVIDRRSAG